MFEQAVAMYGSNLTLMHAFFPGFDVELLEKKLRKLQKTAEKKKWS
jgi:hypothetical protein